MRLNNEIYITKEDMAAGVTLKLEQGDVVRVRSWTNKHGNDALFTAPKKGTYKIHGQIQEVQTH